MAKRYTRLNWQNKPSVATPINATNLNKMDKGIDDIDTALNNLENSIVGQIVNDPTKINNAAVNYSLANQITELNNNLGDFNSQLTAVANDLETNYFKKNEATIIVSPKGNSSYASLPTTGNNQGDYYYCPDGDGVNGAGNYIWDGTAWYFGGTGDEGYSKLKSDLAQISERKNLFTVDNTFIATNGLVSPNQDYVSTDFIEIHKNEVITLYDVISSNWNSSVAFYDSEKNFISSITGVTAYVYRVSAIPSNAMYFRGCSFKNGNNPSISMFAFSGLYDGLKEIDDKLTRFSTNDIIYSNENNIAIGTNAQASNEINHNEITFNFTELKSYVLWIAVNWDMKVGDIVTIDFGHNAESILALTPSISGYALTSFPVLKSGDYVGNAYRVQGTNVYRFEVTQTVYDVIKDYYGLNFRCQFTSIMENSSLKATVRINGENVLLTQELAAVKDEIRNLSKYQGKKVLYLGDSITANNGWTNEVDRILKPSKSVKVAVHGATWADHDGTVYDGNPVLNGPDNNKNNVIGNQVEKIIRGKDSTHPNYVHNADYDDFDIIFVAAGTNDNKLFTENDISEIDNQFYVNGRVVPIDEVDRRTWAGIMRYTYEKLRGLYPNADIFYCSPIQAAETQRPYKNILSMSKMMKAVCDRISDVTFINTFECGICGIYETKDSTGKDLADGLHPIPATGGKKQGRYNARKIIEFYLVE